MNLVPDLTRPQFKDMPVDERPPSIECRQGVVRTEILTTEDGEDFVQFVTGNNHRYRIQVGKIW